MKKLIAVTQRVEYIEAIGECRDALSQEWAVLAEACGFIPLLLPNHLPTVRELLAALPVGGVLLTGGNDLCAYGGDAPERDEVEQFLLQWSIEKKLPLLGVCRGMQVVLNHFGSSIFNSKDNTSDTVSISKSIKTLILIPNAFAIFIS